MAAGDRRLRAALTTPATAWTVLAALWATGAVAAWVWPGASPHLVWSRADLPNQPWRLWTAAFVHLGPLHLAANLGGLALVAWFGRVAGAPAAWAAAWAAAAVLTHALLLGARDLGQFAGLSGVLHAGVAVAAVGVLSQTGLRRRAVGAAILAGLVLKVLLESPWGPVLRTGPGGMLVVPLAHALGVASGCLAAAVALVITRPSAH